MPIGSPGRRSEPLYIIPMALALVLAAFLGGAAGLLWHALDGEAEEAAEMERESSAS